MLTTPVRTIANRARRFVRIVRETAGETCTLQVVNAETQTGSGSLPAKLIPTKAVAVTSEHKSAEEIAVALRTGDPPVFPRVEGGRVLLDFRTVLNDEVRPMAEALVRAVR